MVVLKKIKASTLMETLVATVLIIVIFIVSSMILNNLFLNITNSNTRKITSHLNELEYLYINDKLVLPYKDELDNWTITVSKDEFENQQRVILTAFNPITEKSIEVINYNE